MRVCAFACVRVCVLACVCVYVRYSSSSPGEGKGGSRYIIFRELYYPLQVGPWTGNARPPDLGCPRIGLGLG